ncbi:hypothetical protein HYV80_00295 [Candidatus Woesearchaeota archaeon]|nr:hypothetical protein [Candidatus Woesearchaeota archaeon]
MILAMPSAFAVTTSELKPVLKQALITYFENHSDSKLSVPELRDLLISFFETPTGQEVNLLEFDMGNEFKKLTRKDVQWLL